MAGCTSPATDRSSPPVNPRQRNERAALAVARRIRAIALACAALASACGDQHDPAPPSGNVHLRSEIGRAPRCSDNEPCTDEYEHFRVIATPYARPIEQQALDARLQAIARGEAPIYDAAQPEATLRQALIDGLGIGFLLDGLDDRRLDVIVTAERDTAYYHETELALVDPWIGEVPAILLTPLGPGPFPGVVAVHGHGDDAAIYRDRYHGSEYPGHGYAVLILTMRAMGIDDAEHTISRELLLDGFSLMGLRVYESLLGLRYLRSRADVRADAIGLIGHSGGSSTGNLTIRVQPPGSSHGFRAYVSDHHVDYFSSSPIEPYHCETVPALYPYHPAINVLAGAPIATLTVPYAYPFGVAGIFRFFDAQLKS